jgi:hypothetical protein
MKQTILPARHWYQTDNGKWASREKTAEDHAEDRELMASLGIGEDKPLGEFCNTDIKSAASVAEVMRAMRKADE